MCACRTTTHYITYTHSYIIYVCVGHIQISDEKHAHTHTMGKTAHEKCEELLETVKKEYESEIPVQNLIKMIAKNIGADSRTVDNYIRYLGIFGMMKLKGNGIMKISK